MPGASIAMEAVSFRHGTGDEPFAFDVSFAAGKVTAVLGPSGSGKSTMLNLLAGFESVGSGRVLLDGADIAQTHPSQRPMSMIFQDHNVFPHLSVAHNVGLGIDPSLSPDGQMLSRIEQALADVGLADYSDRKPETLSGGERQRIALARILVRDRPILLLDEALASLGPGMRKSILHLIGTLQQQRNLTVIMVTHDPVDAMMVADDVVFIDGRRIIAHGPADDILSGSSDARITTYLGSGT